MEYKVWILTAPTYNKTWPYECEFVGTIQECLDYARDVEPRFGWVISDARNEFVCSGEVVEAWNKRILHAR